MLASFLSMARELFFLSPCQFVDECCLAGLFLFIPSLSLPFRAFICI
jgi:hypothetical protein